MPAARRFIIIVLESQRLRLRRLPRRRYFREFITLYASGIARLQYSNSDTS
jgi:hypothetical protein